MSILPYNPFEIERKINLPPKMGTDYFSGKSTSKFHCTKGRVKSHKTGKHVRHWRNCDCVFFTDFTRKDHLQLPLDSKTGLETLNSYKCGGSNPVGALVCSLQRGKETGRLHIQGCAWARGGPYTIQEWRKILDLESCLLEPIDRWSDACNYVISSTTNVSPVRQEGAYGSMSGWQVKPVNSEALETARLALTRLMQQPPNRSAEVLGSPLSGSKEAYTGPDRGEERKMEEHAQRRS